MEPRFWAHRELYCKVEGCLSVSFNFSSYIKSRGEGFPTAQALVFQGPFLKKVINKITKETNLKC